MLVHEAKYINILSRIISEEYLNIETSIVHCHGFLSLRDYFFIYNDGGC